MRDSQTISSKVEMERRKIYRWKLRDKQNHEINDTRIGFILKKKNRENIFFFMFHLIDWFLFRLLPRDFNQFVWIDNLYIKYISDILFLNTW